MTALCGVLTPSDRCAGRPVGDVRLALLQAAAALSAPDHSPTLKELAAHACVGHAAARMAVSNMRRAGQLVIVRLRPVAYRRRPVAEYAPSVADGQAAGPFLQALMGAWVNQSN